MYTYTDVSVGLQEALTKYPKTSKLSENNTAPVDSGQYIINSNYITQCRTHTHNRLTAFGPGLPR